jgi:EAL domain-containing protein (putative c-di-GMP-specific phosphodiesterase class I)
MEALLRWQHPDRGIILPDEFIPLAEEVGLIVPLGEWVLRTACAQNREWQKKGHSSLRVSVNISGQQLQQQNFIETVTGALEACGLEPGSLMLEITESIVMQHSTENADIFCELSGKGVRFSMDDFGTGYSSLSYLKSFVIHEIKIDRSFVKDITFGVDDTAIARAIIAMARSLNLDVVAEGVETEPQMKVLSAEGCYAMQGNIISHPIPGGEVLRFLAQSRTPGEEMRISTGNNPADQSRSYDNSGHRPAPDVQFPPACYSSFQRRSPEAVLSLRLYRAHVASGSTLPGEDNQACRREAL